MKDEIKWAFSENIVKALFYQVPQLELGLVIQLFGFFSSEALSSAETNYISLLKNHFSEHYLPISHQWTNPLHITILF